MQSLLVGSSTILPLSRGAGLVSAEKTDPIYRWITPTFLFYFDLQQQRQIKEWIKGFNACLCTGLVSTSSSGSVQNQPFTVYILLFHNWVATAEEPSTNSEWVSVRLLHHRLPLVCSSAVHFSAGHLLCFVLNLDRILLSYFVHCPFWKSQLFFFFLPLFLILLQRIANRRWATMTDIWQAFSTWW